MKVDIGKEAKRVSINGIDVLRTGEMAFDFANSGESKIRGATSQETLIAKRVAERVVKMRNKGYLTKDLARFARQAIVAAAQCQPLVNGGRPVVEGVPQRILTLPGLPR